MHTFRCQFFEGNTGYEKTKHDLFIEARTENAARNKAIRLTGDKEWDSRSSKGFSLSNGGWAVRRCATAEEFGKAVIACAADGDAVIANAIQKLYDEDGLEAPEEFCFGS